jgi:hypothetical protein
MKASSTHEENKLKTGIKQAKEKTLTGGRQDENKVRTRQSVLGDNLSGGDNVLLSESLHGESKQFHPGCKA